MKESKIIEEFQEEARLETRREDVMEDSHIKFGAAAAREFRSALQEITDSNGLARLQRLALRCAGLEEFRRRFQKT
jgi:hypothetical protein